MWPSTAATFTLHPRTVCIHRLHLWAAVNGDGWSGLDARCLVVTRQLQENESSPTCLVLSKMIVALPASR